MPDDPSGGWSFRIVGGHASQPGRTWGEATLEAVLARYLAKLERKPKRRPETLRHARSALDRLVKGLNLRAVDDVTKPLIEAWRDRRTAAGSSNRTANHEVSILSAALNLAVKDRLLQVNPLAGLEALPTSDEYRVRKARALTDDEIERLLAAALRVDAASRGRFPSEPTLAALLCTAARWGELVATRWADLEVSRGILTLRAETTKSKRTRAIPIPKDELQRILRLKEVHVLVNGVPPAPTTRIFLSPFGRPWMNTTTNFHRYLHEVMRVADVPYKDADGNVLHVHALRHTCASRWHRMGMPLADLQRLLGHSDPKLTAQVYVHANVDFVRRWVLPLPRRADAGTF